jgi:mannose-6-phosphate isomerase-like protein (cupin superfamily)
MTKERLKRTQHLSRVNIVGAARSNDRFRREIMTGVHQQVVLMTIPPGRDIGEEVHPDTDQALLLVEGEGDAKLDGATSRVGANDLVLVRAGTRHNFVNTGRGPLRLITIYAPPHHRPGTVHRTKEDAEAADRHGVRIAEGVKP